MGLINSVSAPPRRWSYVCIYYLRVYICMYVSVYLLLPMFGEIK